MRRLSILILLLMIPRAARAALFEARSPQHAAAIEVVSIDADNVRYDVTVTDLATHDVLAAAQLPVRRGLAADKSVEIRDLRIHIHVVETGAFLQSGIEIWQGSDLIDFLHSAWSTAPQRRHDLPPGVMRVGGDVKAPVVLKHVEPMYPEEARKARISGIVIVQAIIDHTGAVKDVTVLKPLPFGLDQAAVDAVRQWTFQPATMNDKPVDVAFNITINFKLVMPAQTPPPPPPPPSPY